MVQFQKMQETGPRDLHISLSCLPPPTELQALSTTKKKRVSRNSGVKDYYFIQMYLLYRYLLLKNNM